MATKTFKPDRTDYDNAARAINALSSKDQLRLKGAMRTLQLTKIAFQASERTKFSRQHFGKAIATAQRNAQAPWE